MFTLAAARRAGARSLTAGRIAAAGARRAEERGLLPLGGARAVARGDDGVDAAADHEVADDLHPLRVDGAHEVVADPVRHGLVEGALVAEAPEVELEALQLDAELRRHVA